MPQAVKVGLFFTLCLAVLAFLVLKVEHLNPFGDPGTRVDAVFDSVVGLDDKAPVRVAGVRVGRVDGVRLDGQRARVTLLLEQPVPLTEGSRASITNAGILGDKYIELILGPPGGAPLPPDAVLDGIAPITFDQALGRLNELGGSLQEITGDLAQRDIGATIGRLLENLEATSADIRLLVASNRDQLDATFYNFERFSSTLADELPVLSRQIRGLVSQVDAVVSENRDEIRGGLENIRTLSERLQVAADNLNEISGQIASGEGTLGKLVYSDEAHDGLVTTLDSVKEGVNTLGETLGRIQKIEFDLGLEGMYFTEIEESRAAFSIRIDPGKDRFYLVEAVDDPRGRQRNKTETITTTFPDGRTETTIIDTLTQEDKITLSAQFGFSFGQADFRAGLFESTGGAAVDYHLMDRRLRLSLEAFDFSRENDLEPRLRLTGRWHFHDNLFLTGGYDDVLEGERRSVFLGGGIRWNDEDLKYLLGSVPSF